MSGGISATTVMAGASIAASVGSMAMGALGSMSSSAAASAAARNQAAAAQYQAQVARNQEQVLLWQAADAEKRGQVAEDQRRTKTRLQIGAQRAALASMGADINSGSAVDIVGDTAAVGEMDALTIRSNSKREAWDKKVAASNAAAGAGMSDYQAAGYSSRASSIDSSSWIGVGSNLLAGASSVADKWSTYKSKGILG